jgi:hypothetical protein
MLPKLNDNTKRFLRECREIMMHAPGGHGFHIDGLGILIREGKIPDWFYAEPEDDEEDDQ